MPESSIAQELKRGDTGRDVKIAQEWLNFHGHGTGTDGKFGPATEAMVKDFQTKRDIKPANGRVSVKTFAALVRPLLDVQQPIAPAGMTLNELVVAYARQHLAVHPVEVGGENRGPWVRLYMGGLEGREWPWCAGFATFVLRQACRTLGVPMPHPYAFGCDFLAGEAKNKGRFLRPKTAADLASVKPGYLFLVRKKHLWQHIGIVEAIAGEAFFTIEGNTNDSGSPEGFEVCRRSRALDSYDFLVV